MKTDKNAHRTQGPGYCININRSLFIEYTWLYLCFLSRYRTTLLLRNLGLNAVPLHGQMSQVRRDFLKDIGNKNISTFYIKVSDLNSQNIVVWRYENARNTV